MIEISEKLLSKGDSGFIKEVAIPIANEIRLIAEEYPTSQDQTSFSEKPQATNTELIGLIGVITFVSSWAVTKLLDEVYDTKIGPILKDKISKYIANKNPKRYAISIAITNRCTSNTIFIVSIGKTQEEIDNNHQIKKYALEMAIQQQENIQLKDNTFLYCIENEKCNLKPYIFDNLESALNSLSRFSPTISNEKSNDS